MARFFEYLDMGGYARYVWPAYFIVIAAIIGNIISARRALKRARIEAQRRLATKSSASSGSSLQGEST
jgi:heme exporter protein CcmD